MILRRRRVLLLSLPALIIFVITCNYLTKFLSKTENEVRKYSEGEVVQKILQKLETVLNNYKTKRVRQDPTITSFIRNLQQVAYTKRKDKLWKLARSWISKTQLYNYSSPELGNILYALRSSEITKADIDNRGTQLKLLLTLEGGQQAIFKPRWYPLDKIIEGPVYAGKDRYNSEIIAFYLSAFLEKPLTPLTNVRRLSLRNDISPVATTRLLETMFTYQSQTCVYGKCYYCKREDPICDDTNNTLTGAIIFNVDINFKNNRSPWQRTYKRDKKALWEVDNHYCKSVKSKLSLHRILDLIDTSIFDFLLQNGDRHHYETLDDNVLLLDNGKGLGNPYVHHLDILAPLYQCCMLRNSTWTRLQVLSGGSLSEYFQLIPNIWNYITREHLEAIEKRLMLIYATVEYCRSRNKVEHSVY